MNSTPRTTAARCAHVFNAGQAGNAHECGWRPWQWVEYGGATAVNPMLSLDDLFRICYSFKVRGCPPPLTLLRISISNNAHLAALVTARTTFAPPNAALALTACPSMPVLVHVGGRQCHCTAWSRP